MQASPLARTHALVVRDFSDEVVVYDETRHRAYCLNRSAAALWRLCDGRTSVQEMAERLAAAVGQHVEGDLVQLGLARLAQAHLLLNMPPPKERPSRREMLRRLGGTGAALLPVVVSLVVPPAAQAVSCGCPVTTGGVCNQAGCARNSPCGKDCTKRCQSNGVCH